MTGLTVDASISSETDLFGKSADDLQENIVIGRGTISGTLKYIDDYEGFSSDTSLNSGNYLAIHAEVPDVTGVTITVKVTNPVTLDEDGIAVLRIADKSSQTVTVVASKDGCNDVIKEFDLRGLICEDE